MANIDKELNQIKHAVYGREVRRSIHDSVDKINKESEGSRQIANNTEQRQGAVEQQFNTLLSEWSDDKPIDNAETIAARTNTKESKTYENLGKRLDEEYGKVTAQLADIVKLLKFVTYDSFGIDGREKYYNPTDGNYYLDESFTQIYDIDDGIKIKECHEFANEHNIPVIQPSGHYVIKETRDIPIMTDVDLGKSVFHIDESKTPEESSYVFRVVSDHEPMNLNSNLFSDVLPYMKKGRLYIPPLKDYKNHFVVVKNNNKIIAKRQGAAPKTHYLEDFFYVGEGGRIVGDIAWDFDEITNIDVRKCDENYLEIKSGTFLLSGNLAAADYRSNGILINRSRVIIGEQFVGLDGVEDISSAATAGFYSFRNAYDVTLERTRLIPRISSGTGTYGIGGNRVIDFKILDIDAGGSTDHWGIMGSNSIKNLKVRDSKMNRIDVHFFAWNVDIYNCDIGDNGVRLSGGGTLNIGNTSVEGSIFCNFREDYGARWDGDINLTGKNTLKVTRNQHVGILGFLPNNSDYVYDIIFGENIKVNDFTFDYTALPTNNYRAEMLRLNEVNEASGERVTYPTTMHFKDIKVKGRERGCNLLTLRSPSRYKIRNKASYSITENSVEIDPNAKYIFENVNTTRTVDVLHPGFDSHIHALSSGGQYTDEYSLVPEIVVIDCGELQVNVTAAIMKISIEKTTITSFNAESGGFSRTNTLFANSDIKPNIISSNNAFRYEGSEVVFLNCKVYPYTHNGSEDMSASTTKTGIYEVGSQSFRVDGVHVNTRLSKKIIEYLDTKHTREDVDRVLKMLQTSNVRFDETYGKYHLWQ